MPSSDGACSPVIPKREAVARQLASDLPPTDASYISARTLAEVDGAHSGASLLALQKVLAALRKQ
jgi:hypothetical protein